MKAAARQPAALPSVSIVVLNHNYERYVARRWPARRAGARWLRLAEVVVVDDGSTDRSSDVYERFRDVRVVSRPTTASLPR